MKYGERYVIALRLENGEYYLVEGSSEPFSKKQVRQAFKRFKGDGDVKGACCLDAARFFESKSEMTQFFKKMYHE